MNRKLPNPNPARANAFWLLALFLAAATVSTVVLLALPQGVAPAPCGVQVAVTECGGDA